MKDSDTSTHKPTGDAADIMFPLLERVQAGGFLYRVYKNKEDYIDVTAQTAADAVTKSDIPDPMKIIHLHARLPDILDVAALGLRTGGMREAD